MSTLGLRAPAAIDPPSPVTLRVRWTLSRAALRACAPEFIRARIADSGADPELVWRVVCAQGTIEEAHASILDAGAAVWHAPAAPGGRVLEADALIHADIPAPGPTLRATWRRTPHALAPIYAATGVLAMLALPGGRYEIA